MKDKIATIIQSLDSNYNSFLEYLPFDQSRLFFHKRTVELASNELHIRHLRYIYENIILYKEQTNLEEDIQLYSFPVFFNSILNLKEIIQRITDAKIESFIDWSLLNTLFENIMIVESGPKFIIHSLVASQLIPELCPALSQEYHIPFFKLDLEEIEKNLAGTTAYADLISSFYQPLAQNKDVKIFFFKYQKTSSWNTSYPKFLNHLLIGSIINQSRTPEEKLPLIEAVV